SWRSRHPGGVLWLDAGDAFHGAPLASLLDGDPVVDVLNAAGLDAMALGNHDFNFGQARLVVLMEQARFPILSANTVRFDANAPVGAPGGFGLVAALEQGLRAYPQMSGGFLQVSGLTFVFDPGRPVGERVVEVKVGGEPVDYGRTYRVAVNDFLAAGGSGHTTLARARVYLAADDDGGISVYDAVQAYLEKVGEVAPRVEDRIRAVETAGERAEPVGAEEPSPGGS